MADEKKDETSGEEESDLWIESEPESDSEFNLDFESGADSDFKLDLESGSEPEPGPESEPEPESSPEPETETQPSSGGPAKETGGDSFLDAFMEDALAEKSEEGETGGSLGASLGAVAGSDEESDTGGSLGMSLEGVAEAEEDTYKTAGEEEEEQGSPLDKPSEAVAEKKKIPLSEWFKKNPKAAIGIGAGGGLVLILVLLFATGIIGGKKKKKRRAPPPVAARPTPPPQPAPPAKVPPGKQGTTPAKGKQPAEGEAAAGGEKTKEGEKTKPEETEPEKPSRPENVAEWVKEHYFSARAEGDPKLPEAVEQFGKRFADSAPAAQMLADLLAPPKEEEVDPKNPHPRRRPVRGGPATLIEAVVTALEANTTPESRTILKDLLAGNRPVEDDKKTVDVVLKTLAGHPSTGNQVILYQVLTQPEKFRAESAGSVGTAGPAGSTEDVTAGGLRKQVFTLVQPIASDQFRTALAKFVCQPNLPPDQREKFGKFLETNLPENAGAQLVFYQQPEIDDKLLKTLEKQLTGFSSESLGKLLGVKASTAAGRAARRPLVRHVPGAKAPEEDPDLPYRVAAQLWSPASVSFLEGRVRQTKSLERQAQVLAFASTFPTDSMRSTLYGILDKNWDDGPAELVKANQGLITDPGFLVLVKLLPREMPKNARSARPGARPAVRPAPRSGARPGSAQALREAAEAARQAEQRREQAKLDWMTASRDLACSWCDVLNAAAGEKGQSAPANPEPVRNLPFQISKNAEIVAEYHVRWPNNQTRAMLPGVALGPLDMHYVRTEQKLPQRERTKLLGFYTRQLRFRGDPCPAPGRNGGWIESFRAVSERRTMRSIDVFFSEGVRDPDADPEEGDPVIVEILSVEMLDPRRT